LASGGRASLVERIHIFYALIETAQMCGLDPTTYLIEATERAIRNPKSITLPQDYAAERMAKATAPKGWARVRSTRSAALDGSMETRVCRRTAGSRAELGPPRWRGCTPI
jgi:hypothetical protein